MCRDRFRLLVADALGLVAAVLVPLQEIVRTLHDGLAVALNAVGLGAEMTADHVIDAGHIFEDAGALFLEGGEGHNDDRCMLYSIYTILAQEFQENKPVSSFSDQTPRISLTPVPATDAVVIDGKEVCDAKLMLVNAVAQPSQRVLGVEPVAAKTNEIPTARTLLQRLSLTGRLVQLDGLHPQHQTVHQIRYEKGAADSLILRANQPTLLQTAQTLLPESVPPSGPAAERAGRAERIPGAGRQNDCAHRPGAGWGPANCAAGPPHRGPRPADPHVASELARARRNERGAVVRPGTRPLGH